MRKDKPKRYYVLDYQAHGATDGDPISAVSSAWGKPAKTLPRYIGGIELTFIVPDLARGEKGAIVGVPVAMSVEEQCSGKHRSVESFYGPIAIAGPLAESLTRRQIKAIQKHIQAYAENDVLIYRIHSEGRKR